MLRNRLWAAVVLVTLEERCALLPLRQEACFRNWFESGRAEPGLLRGGDALVFGLVQSGDDVRGAARLVAASFPSVTVGRSDVAWEDAALQTLSRLAAQWDVVEYSFAMQSRCGNRLRDARLATRDNTESLVFAVTTRDDDEVIACVELRLKDADGSAPPAFPRFQEWNEQPLPYISNVCVAPQFRRAPHRIGSCVDASPNEAPPDAGAASLRRCSTCATASSIASLLDWEARRAAVLRRARLQAAEYISAEVWGYDAVFLHVGSANANARRLYEASKYVEVRDLFEEPLAYYGKRLAGARDLVETATAAARSKALGRWHWRRGAALLPRPLRLALAAAWPEDAPHATQESRRDTK